MCLSGVTRRYDRRSCYFNYTEREQEAQDLMNNKAGGGYLLENPELTFTSEEKETINEYKTELETAGKEFATKYVLGTETGDAAWNAWVERAGKLGATATIKAYNDAQKRYDSK